MIIESVKNILERLFKKNSTGSMPVYFSDYSEFEDGKRLYDLDVMNYALDHMRVVDLLRARKVMQAYRYSFDILSGAIVPENGDDFKFVFKE